MTKQKVLIIGASGFVGNYLYQQLNNNTGIDLYGTYNNSSAKGLFQFNYKTKKNFKIIDKINPDIIIWAAGEKNLKKTELSLAATLNNNLNPFISLINCKSVNNKTKIIFLSSDYVFDGISGGYKVTDNTNPKSNYGTAKVMCEKYLMNNHFNYNIIRAGGILGQDSLFLKWLVQSIKKDDSIELFDNIFSPTPIVNIYNCIEEIINDRLNEKIIHITGNKKLSRYEIGVFVSDILKSKISIIKTNYLESEFAFFKDLSLISSFESKKNVETNDFLTKIIK